jgi:predicted homoserine dehydrogenase-like protein
VSEGIEAKRPGIAADSTTLIATTPEINVVLEVTGNPAACIRYVLLCCEYKKH